MNTQENIERQLLDWAFSELRKECTRQIKKMQVFAGASADTQDIDGVKKFSAAATAWRQAYNMIVDVDVRVLFKREELEKTQDYEQ